MFIVPRTPASPKRMITSPTSTGSLISVRSKESVLTNDIYDRFAEIYFSVDIKVQNILLKQIIDYVGHPIYTHLLQTMDQYNSQYVMGYLRSQRSVEMYIILEYICRNPLPTKNNFHRNMSGL